MSTLVTGAGGFIGSNVVRELLRRGDRVRALLHPAESDRELADLKGEPVEIVRGDILDDAGLARAFDGVAKVYHLAAIYSVARRDDQRTYAVNLLGSQKVLAEALRRRVEKLVYTSSIAAVGNRPAWRLDDPDSLPNESTPWNREHEANAYVHSKYLSEEIARSFARLGLPVVIVNPAFPFGPRDDRPTPTGRILLDQLALNPPYWIEGALCVVDVRDVARWHVVAEERGRVGERYILGAENLTLKEIAERVARIAGLQQPRFAMPDPAARAVVKVEDWVSHNITRQPPLGTPETLALAQSGFVFDVRKAHGELGAPRYGFDESVRDAIAWWRQSGLLGAHQKREALRRTLMGGGLRAPAIA